MNRIMTYYEVLQPTQVEDLYKVTDTFAYETKMCHSKTPEYIRQLLVSTGMYPADILVQRKSNQ